MTALDALDPIEAHKACNVNEVILIGLSAGAEIALRYGYTDERVIGLVLLDPTIPHTARFMSATSVDG